MHLSVHPFPVSSHLRQHANGEEKRQFAMRGISPLGALLDCGAEKDEECRALIGVFGTA